MSSRALGLRPSHCRFLVFVGLLWLTACVFFFQYEDDVLEAVFGGAEGLKDEAAQDSFVALVALPGYFVAVALIAKLGPRNVQVRIVFLGVLLSTAVWLNQRSAWLKGRFVSRTPSVVCYEAKTLKLLRHVCLRATCYCLASHA